jgi:hypothetical protein
MKRLVRDGLIAVLYTNDYGGGWYSWHGYLPALYDPGLVELIEQKQYKKAHAYVEAKQAAGEWPDFYVHEITIENLAVDWVVPNREFRITEYDGLETLEYRDDIRWTVATVPV